MCMDETMDLIRRAHAGDEEAREQLVMGNVGLVWSVARHYSGRGHDLEDLFQIGCIGLLKAVDKFDLGFQVRFSTYAVPMIAGEIRRFLRDDGMIRVSRSMKELGLRVRRARETLTNWISAVRKWLPAWERGQRWNPCTGRPETARRAACVSWTAFRTERRTKNSS